MIRRLIRRIPLLILIFLVGMTVTLMLADTSMWISFGALMTALALQGIGSYRIRESSARS